MTEQAIFDSLCYWHGGPLLDRDTARTTLLARIKAKPAWVYCLPESLLVKLNIEFDHVYQQGDVQLAAAIKGQLERRIL